MREHAIPLISCPPLPDLLLALGGDQALPETRSVTAHLRHCAVCRESLGEVEGALTVAAAARAREIASLDFSIDGAAARKRRVMSRLAQVKQQRQVRRVRVRPRPRLIVMAIVLIASWLILPHSGVGPKVFLQCVDLLVRHAFGLDEPIVRGEPQLSTILRNE